jgi:hypothetical protein
MATFHTNSIEKELEARKNSMRGNIFDDFNIDDVKELYNKNEAQYLDNGTEFIFSHTEQCAMFWQSLFRGSFLQTFVLEVVQKYAGDVKKLSVDLQIDLISYYFENIYRIVFFFTACANYDVKLVTSFPKRWQDANKGGEYEETDCWMNNGKKESGKSWVLYKNPFNKIFQDHTGCDISLISQIRNANAHTTIVKGPFGIVVPNGTAEPTRLTPEELTVVASFCRDYAQIAVRFYTMLFINRRIWPLLYVSILTRSKQARTDYGWDAINFVSKEKDSAKAKAKGKGKGKSSTSRPKVDEYIDTMPLLAYSALEILYNTLWAHISSRRGLINSYLLKKNKFFDIEKFDLLKVAYIYRTSKIRPFIDQITSMMHNCANQDETMWMKEYVELKANFMRFKINIENRDYIFADMYDELMQGKNADSQLSDLNKMLIVCLHPFFKSTPNMIYSIHAKCIRPI